MADVFRRFIANLTTTDLTTVFTVPTANVAATPPVPVSTFIVKTINTHNYDGSNSVTVNVDHNNGSADLQVFQIDVSASNNEPDAETSILSATLKLALAKSLASNSI